MESFWRINIAERDGDHWFHYFNVDVAGYDIKRVKRIYTDLKRSFPDPQYKLDVTRWDCLGQRVEL